MQEMSNFSNLSDHNGIKLKINNKWNCIKYTNTEIEQYTFEWSGGHWRNQGDLKNPRSKENGNKTYQNR
jgi:hypothetical protein